VLLLVLAFVGCLPTLDGVSGGLGDAGGDAGSNDARADVLASSVADASPDVASFDSGTADVGGADGSADASDAAVDAATDPSYDGGVPNGDFEQGAAECGFNWQPSQSSTLRKVPGINGGSACEVCARSPYSGVTNTNPIPVAGAGSHYFSYYVANVQGKASAASLQTLIIAAPDGPSARHNQTNIAPEANWKLYERPDFSALAGDKLTFRIEITDFVTGGPEQCFVIDNIGLHKAL
jgi:hypothetical protein